ncbi:hypothetical protein FRC07_007870 [Ceratobasidium sp. 392]|nr:hypothetical protein FRC07_007870 [Ceratobasidium sp. 392]
MAIVSAGNTTCKTTSLDWYTQSSRELRPKQIRFVQQSIFCQYGVGSGEGADSGYDARVGVDITLSQFYQLISSLYRPEDIEPILEIAAQVQTRGDWYYIYTKQTAQLQIQSGQNGTKCATTSGTLTSVDPTSTAPSSTNIDPDNSSGPNVGAIVGGVVGDIGLLAITSLVVWFGRRRRSPGIVDLTEEQREPDMTFEPYVNRPVAAQSTDPSNGVPTSSASYTHPNPSSDATPTAAFAPPQRPAKAGLVAISPPNRDEVGQSAMGSSSWALSCDRHEDSADLTSAFGLSRSASGRLPPTY